MVLGVIGSLVGSVVGWLIGLVVGGLALFLAAEFVVQDNHTVGYGLVTALAGAIVWALLSLVPAIGFLLAPLGWVAVIHVRYPGDLKESIVVAAVAWFVAIVILFVLGLVGLGGLSAVGVPFA